MRRMSPYPLKKKEANKGNMRQSAVDFTAKIATTVALQVSTMTAAFRPFIISC